MKNEKVKVIEEIFVKNINSNNDVNKKNILILNAHWMNRGDESAIRAMIDSLKSKLPVNNIKIMLMSEDQSFFPYRDIEILPWFPNPNLYGSQKIKWILQFFEMAIIILFGGRLAISKNGKKFIRSVKESDIVIHAPGGPNIGDLYSVYLGYFEFVYLFRLLIAIFNNKFLFFYAPSMGPFQNRAKNILRRYILKKARTLVVRDKISKKYLNDHLGLDSVCTIDSAFQNSIPQGYLEDHYDFNLEEFRNEKIIGISVSDLGWHTSHKHNKEKILAEFCKLIDYLTHKGYLILLIPQLFSQNDYDMEELSLLKKIQHINENMIIILPTLDSYAIQEITSKLYSVISIRYHQNVFAAKANIPFLAISYEHKTKGLMEKLEIPYLSIDVNSISIEELINKFGILEENYMMIKEKLIKKMPELKKTSQRTTTILVRDFEDFLED